MKRAIIHGLIIAFLVGCFSTGAGAVQVSAATVDNSDSWDFSHRLEEWDGGIEGYFEEKYAQSTDWSMISSKSTADVSGYLPIEMQGGDSDMFPSSDIDTAIGTSGIESSYGGCGPIAMIGVMDYFARYLGYTSIIDDPTNSTDRILLAYDVFTTTITYEMPALSVEVSNEALYSFPEDDVATIGNSVDVLAYQQAAALSSGGDKNTLTLPVHYVSAFNELMTEKYHLDAQIVAKDQGMLVSTDSKISKVKDSIDKGLPVTIYTGLAGDGHLANHYVNAYEYQEWQGTDANGNPISNYVFKVRLNWGWGQNYACYMDAELLSSSISGVIYYTVTDGNHLIRPVDFADNFVNDNGQGQYFFYEKTADITTSEGFKFGTSRLRCGYIENQYLVLSANRADAGLAYLEMDFDISIKAMNFDAALWSGLEGLGADDYAKLYYKDANGDWQVLMTIDLFSLSTRKDYPDNFYVTFPVETSGIKFEVYDATPSGDRNKGRIVIGDMILFYED